MADVEHVPGAGYVEAANADRDVSAVGVEPDDRTARAEREVSTAVGRTLLATIADAPWRLTSAAGALVALSTAAQLWFAPFLIGLAFGIVLRHRRARAVAGFTTLATASGWALPLAARIALGEPVLGIARVTAGLAGLPAIGALTVLATLLIAVIQGLTGVWFARAVSGLRRA